MQDGRCGGMGAGVVEWLRSVFRYQTPSLGDERHQLGPRAGRPHWRSDHRHRPQPSNPSSPGHCSVEGTMQRPSFFHDETELGDEERLVARCLRGEASAWEMMFNLYHPQLVSIIKAMMHGEGAAEQAEEIAAAVWSSLCSEAFTRLRHFDPHVGRLLGYLANMARSEIRKGRRSQTQSLFSGMHGCSQRSYVRRDWERTCHPGIPGHPDPPGTRVLHVRPHDAIKSDRPARGFFDQRMAAPKPGVEKVPYLLLAGYFHRMKYRFVRNRYFVVLSVMGSAMRDVIERPKKQRRYTVVGILFSSICLHRSINFPSH